jgi:diguanylate cyclase (GGDEF)-like protein
MAARAGGAAVARAPGELFVKVLQAYSRLTPPARCYPCDLRPPAILLHITELDIETGVRAPPPSLTRCLRTVDRRGRTVASDRRTTDSSEVLSRGMPEVVRPSIGPAPDSIVKLVVVRALLYLGAAAVPLLLVEADGARWAAAICVVAACLQPALIPISRRVHFRIAEAVFDTAVAIAIAFAVPSLWYTWLIVVVAGSTLLSAIVRPDLHLLVLALLIQGLLLLGATVGSTEWTINAFVGGAVLIVAVRGTIGFRRHLQTTADSLDHAMGAAQAFMQTVDLDRREIVELTGDVEAVTGWDLDTWRTLRKADITHPDDLPAARDTMMRLKHQTELDLVVRIFGPDGRMRWLRCTGKIEPDQRGRPMLRAFLVDVTAIHKISDELHEQARRDRTTGLPNRQRLEEDLDLRAVHAERFALLIADIRQFKAINDTLGHHIGDLVLSMTGTRLTELANPDWSVYRLSADQFAVMITGSNDADRALVAAHQIAQECRRPYHVGRVALGAPVAVGIAVSAANVAPSVTLRQADVAVNAAKGTNSSVETYHADMQRFTLENLVLSAAVEQGLDQGEFVLNFQPQVDLRTGQIVGAEGLVRWHHPERGLLAPASFLETVRLSASFDRFTLDVVRQAIRAAAAAQGAPQSIGFGVNIELSSLLTAGFTDSLIAELEAHSIGRHRVVLEVTETDLAERLVANSSIDLGAELERLRAHGFQIAIDDFGTGSSSLFRLDRMPADELKIDRAFLHGIGNSPRSEMLLSSVIQLGTNLGLRVVAEGIEEPEQLAYVSKAGCTVGQGWLFSKAVPVAELLAGLHIRYPVSDAPHRNVTQLRPNRRA